MNFPAALDAVAAFSRYVEVAPRLPTVVGARRSVLAAHLGELVDEIDVFVLDGFGVLNVGFEPVPGAAARLDELRRVGCELRVLTNGATQPTELTAAKYHGWSMPIERHEVISSRDALTRALRGRAGRWGFMARDVSALDTFGVDAVLLEDDASVYADVDGIVLLGSGDWSARRHALLREALAARARPVLVGNPDLVAPFADGFSREPGLFAHALADEGLARPEFFGKPFANAFEPVIETLAADVDPRRIAMVGDTLHTDILGGAAAGWRTVLVTGWGLVRELDAEDCIRRAGFRPDFIVPTT